MTTGLPTIDQAQLSRAISLLDEEWLQDDPDLGPVMPLVLGRGVGQDWHKAGTFRHHLIGVARTLTLWQQPKHVRQLGLLHSVYGNAHVDLMKFDPKSERGRLQEAVGEDAALHDFTVCRCSILTFLFFIRSSLINCKVAPALDFLTATNEKKSFTSIKPTSSFFNFPLLVKNPTMSTLFTLSFFPALM